LKYLIVILLDTAVLIWLLEDLPLLGPRARARIAANGVVHFSTVSIAEIHIKAMTGKLRLPDAMLDRLGPAGLLELPLSGKDAAALSEFPELARHDPFDRLLVAQAHRAGMEFLTSDQTLLSLGREFIGDARV
jgi:PIN domain nuclease of toxin-antitoxin system